MSNFDVQQAISLLQNHHNRAPVAVFTKEGEMLPILGITEIYDRATGIAYVAIVTD